MMKLFCVNAIEKPEFCTKLAELPMLQFLVTEDTHFNHLELSNGNNASIVPLLICPANGKQHVEYTDEPDLGLHSRTFTR